MPNLKNLSAVLIVLLFFFDASAQVNWNPKWQKGKTETLEFSSSNKRIYTSHVDADTAHAIIKVTAKDENEFFYFLDWKVTNYFMDTAKATDNSQKMIYLTISRLMAALPIRVRIEKPSFEIIILNRDKLDSLQKLIAAQVAETYPVKREKPDKELEDVVNMLVSLKIEDNIYSLINDYYCIYAVNGIEFNVKHELGNADYGMRDSLYAQFKKAINEFYILDDKDPNLYKWRYEAKIDWAQLSDEIRNVVKNKPGAFQNIGDMNTDITINKADKLVTYYHYWSDDGNSPGSAHKREVKEKTIKKVN
jgi:hypothetical protein